MSITLSIDRQTCIKCGKCVRVCPSGIFYRTEKGGDVHVRNVETCIVCGHCCAICPTCSVVHSEFPPNKIHKVSAGAFPKPEQVETLIKMRRSNRAFSKEIIPDEYFDRILEAAHRAPTASNAQKVSFTLVTDPEVLRKVVAFTMDTFIGMSKKIGNPLYGPVIRKMVPNAKALLPMFRRLAANYEAGGDPVLRNATALILIHSTDQNRFAAADCNLAYQNASIMAESLGVAHFYTGFVLTALQRDKNHAFTRSLGINGTVHAGMALAMPSARFANYIDKKDIEVNYLL